MPIKRLRTLGVLICAFLFTTAASAEECGSITHVEGDGQIIRSGQSLTVAPDTRIQKGDLIRAPKGSVVEFSMNGVAGLRASDGAECEITGAGAGDMKVDLSLGDLTVNLKKLPPSSSFKVETPTAIATVRGTQFLSRVVMNSNNLPDSSFAVRDSIVDVTAKQSGKTFSVEKGQAIDVPSTPHGNLGIRSATGGEIVGMEGASRITACG